MKKKIQTLFLLSLLVLGGILFYYIKTKIEINRKINRHSIAHQRNTLLSIALEVQFLASDYGPFENIEDVIEKIQEENDKVIFIAKGYCPEDKVIYDRWGNSIKLKVVSPDEYHLISAGPNKKYEEGNGDDIVVSFDPFERLKQIR